VPTKALLHAAELADAARDGVSFGIRSSFDGVDMPAVHAYKESVVGRLYKGLQGLVSSAGVTFVRGEGRLVGTHTVRVGDDDYTDSSLVLATGSYARTLPGLELGARVLTSDEALRLAEVLGRAVIVGGSVIGVEFASVWRSIGAEVTIVEALPSLVPLEDPAVGKQLERAFRKRRIGLRTDTRFEGGELLLRRPIRIDEGSPA
jgi:dihydrolipoamide dehydrogenase